MDDIFFSLGQHVANNSYWSAPFPFKSGKLWETADRRIFHTHKFKNQPPSPKKSVLNRVIEIMHWKFVPWQCLSTQLLNMYTYLYIFISSVNYIFVQRAGSHGSVISFKDHVLSNIWHTWAKLSPNKGNLHRKTLTLDNICSFFHVLKVKMMSQVFFH